MITVIGWHIDAPVCTVCHYLERNAELSWVPPTLSLYSVFICLVLPQPSSPPFFYIFFFTNSSYPYLAKYSFIDIKEDVK